MKSGSFFRLLFLLTVGSFSVWISTASAGPSWCQGNACDFVQLSVNNECLTVTNSSPNKAMTVQLGLYGPFFLRPDQSNTIMFQGRCFGTTIAEALNATFSARAPTPAASLQPQWASADAEVRDIMVRTCLINMPAYVVWLDPDGSLQGPIRVSTGPSWPQGARSSFLGRAEQPRPLDTARLGYMQKLSKERLSAETPPHKIPTKYLGSAKTNRGITIFHGLLGSPPYV